MTGDLIQFSIAKSRHGKCKKMRVIYAKRLAILIHMSSPERPGGQAEEPRKEHEQAPYCLAARFKSETPAKLAYFSAQDLIFGDERADLSAYRFLLDQVSHVALVGKPPPDDLQKKLETLLSKGEPTSLPPDILQALNQRRTEAKNIAPWVEAHYRPGKRLK
jgi:hypothetical protein